MGLRNVKMAGRISRNAQIKMRSGQLLLFRVLDMAGIALTVVCILLLVGMVLREFYDDVLRR
jgi:hypothetical protein